MIFSCPFCQVRIEKRGATTCPSCSQTIVRDCPFCAEGVSVLATACKYCGERLEPAPVAPKKPTTLIAIEPMPAEPVTPDVEYIEPSKPEAPEIEFIDENAEPVAAEAVKSVAWEDPSRGCRFSRWWSTWSSSTFDMANFWKKMPTDAGHRAPIAYSWYLGAMALVVFGLPLMGLLQLGLACDNSSAGAHVGLLVGYAALFPLMYVATALGTWIGAALWHLPLKILGAKGGYQTTVRALSYGAGAKVWLLIPGLGMLISPLMMIFMSYSAFRHAHRMSPARAFIGAMLPVMLVLGLMAAMLVVGVACGGCPAEPSRCVLPPC
jgi:hypothetical protein